MVSKARDDLPDPDRPVMTMSLSRGRSTSTLARLWVRAPRTRMVSRAMRDLKNERTSEFTPHPCRGAKRGQAGMRGQGDNMGVSRRFFHPLQRAERRGFEAGT